MKSKLITPLTDLDKSATISHVTYLGVNKRFPWIVQIWPPDWMIVLCFTPYRQYPSHVTALSQLHVKSIVFYVTMLFLSGYCCNICLLRTPTWFPPYQPRSWFQCHVILIPHTSRVPDHSILVFILFYEVRVFSFSLLFMRIVTMLNFVSMILRTICWEI